MTESSSELRVIPLYQHQMDDPDRTIVYIDYTRLITLNGEPVNDPGCVRITVSDLKQAVPATVDPEVARQIARAINQAADFAEAAERTESR